MNSSREDASPTESRLSCTVVNSTTSSRKWRCRNHSIRQLRWEVMEIQGRHHNRQTPDRRKDSKGDASIVTSSVTGKLNAARKHMTLKTEGSKLDRQQPTDDYKYGRATTTRQPSVEMVDSNDDQKTPHPDSRRQMKSITKQKPMTSNQYDALADELVDHGITFHQSGTAVQEKPTNQRSTGTTDATNTTRTDFIDFHPRTSSSVTFDSQSKTKDKKRCSQKIGYLAQHLAQLIKSIIRYTPSFVLTSTKLTHFWTPEQSNVQGQK